MPDLTLETLKALRADMARFDLHLADVIAEMRRLNSRVSMLRGDSDAIRHDVDLSLERWRDLEIRVRALEQPRDS